MNFATKTLTLLAGCAVASTLVGFAPAQAQEWNYTIDSFDDGSDAGQRGARSDYEFYGMALKETADKVYVAINSNLNLGGEYFRRAADDYIHYGDLFFNFTGANLADSQGDLFAIKFDAGNDSGVDEIGVYGNVTAMNTTASNGGFSTMRSHRNWANKRYRVDGQRVRGTASMGDLSHNDEYFQQGRRAVSNSIESGNYLGGISLLNDEQLANAGLNFGAVNSGVAGRHTLGFSFDRNLLPDGDFIAHVFAECINDGLAMMGNLAPIPVPEVDDTVATPEPGLLMGVALIGGLGLLKRRQAAA
ncbi:MAG: PEP-CTERM sorting domain-containing protein [Leptolyngbya sp. SIOISBB]|nr:PEP-CTERM sorting domain-containing protein [Leptolyngbya sp. SIOISBB]